MAEDDTQVSHGGAAQGSAPGMPVEGENFAGRYYIERLLGRGGMGMVYLAVQSPLDRPVALKVLRPPSEPQMDPRYYSRFLREAEAAVRLQHPNTVTVYDFGTTEEGLPYIVMEYLKGQDLRQVLASQWPFPLRRTLHVASQVCKSLLDAHEKGMIHRDLKPANVLLVKRDDDEDFVKVFDFGLVKFRDEDQDLTQAGIFLGSPRYTFPEALDSKAVVDERADIYSTGILIYTMVAGQPPFSGEPMAVLSAHLNETPRPMCEMDPDALSCPALEAVVARCLRKDPGDRYQSMRDLSEALRAVSRAVEAGEESLELDPSGSVRWEPELDEEERTTQRGLKTLDGASGGTAPSRWRLPLLATLGALLVLGVTAVMMHFLAPGTGAETIAEDPVPLREVGVTVYSQSSDLQVSYMTGEGGWQPLGTISVEQRERWSAGSKEPWWTAEVPPDHRELSLLLVAPGVADRQLSLPIVDGRVRLDATEGLIAPEVEEEEGEVRDGVPKDVPEKVAPAVQTQGRSRASEPADAETGRDAEQPGPISPEYKDNPY